MFKEDHIKFWELPNILSMARIAAIPLVVIFLLWDNRFCNFMGALTYTIAAITDLLDGYMARKMKKTSKAGKLLDPLADKLILLAALVMLIPLERIPAWMVVLIIGREIAVTGFRGIASAEGIVIAASRWGKRKTAFLNVACIFLILGPNNPFFNVSWYLVGYVSLLIGLCFSLYSGWDYFRNLQENRYLAQKN
jgi:CDP-diacylglycerol--glycerol-3-phosphate 3-phosphatidyltransferase